MFSDKLMNLKSQLNVSHEKPSAIPFLVKHYGMDELDTINKKIKTATRDSLRDIVGMEMKNALVSNLMKSRSNKNFIVHYLRSSTMLESIPLQKATRLCTNTPVLVISYTDSMIKARCCVPESYRSNTFNAQTWLNTVSTIFKSVAQAPRGQDPREVCNMKAKRINIQEWDTLLKESLNVAKTFAETHL